MTMNTELNFRIALAVIGSVYTVIRIYYTRKALQGDKNFFRPRSDLRQLVFGTVGFLIIVPVVIYIFAPQQMAWAALSLPAGWRWFGVGLGLVGICLLLWVHQALGKNFAVPAVAKEHQMLMTVGPYRWVRHPMYTVLFLIAVVYFLISANWFIGIVWISWIVGTVASMIRDEEASLIEKFGDEYQAYMRRTGRFLPKEIL
jgi:protein-S-isoprenylcysteine O-methyltransferase Ste14